MVAEMTSARSSNRFQVLLDFDGLLIDMEPFAVELGSAGRDRWSRFVAHTAAAAPWVRAWSWSRRCAESGGATRSPRPGRAVAYAVQPAAPGKKTFVDQRPSIRSWTRAHLPMQPTNVFLRRAPGTVEDVKTEHFYATATAPPKKRMAALFVDDEPAAVDALAEELPALHISDLAGLCDADLAAMLHYSAAAAERLHRRAVPNRLNQ